MADSQRTLLEQITISYGPQELLEAYLALVDGQLRDRGLRVAISTDFERLAELNQQRRDSWPPLWPFHDPRHHELSADNAFWLDVRDSDAKTAVVHAARCCRWPTTSLAEELESLRLCYSNPEPHCFGGETVAVQAPSAPYIAGTVLVTGCTWVRPDLRRRALAGIVPRISRVLAYARWQTSHTVCFVAKEHHRWGVTRAFGDYAVEEDITFRLTTHQASLLLLWMTTERMLGELTKLASKDHAVTQKRDAEREFIVSP